MRTATMGMLVATMLGTAAAPARAQDAAAPRLPFTGGYAGPEAGWQRTGFTLEATTSIGTVEVEASADGLAAGGFAGADLAVAPRVRLGVEAGVTLGGRTPEVRFGPLLFAQEPRFQARLIGRAGYLLGERTMIHVGAGYGGQRYRLTDTIGVANARRWQDGVSVSAGIEHRLSPRIGLRAEYRALVGWTDQIMVGLPIRF